MWILWLHHSKKVSFEGSYQCKTQLRICVLRYPRVIFVPLVVLCQTLSILSLKKHKNPEKQFPYVIQQWQYHLLVGAQRRNISDCCNYFPLTETRSSYWQYPETNRGYSHYDHTSMAHADTRNQDTLNPAQGETSNAHGYTCPYCGKRIMIRHHFIGHLNGHLNVKPHRCNRCSRSFAYGTSLSRHKRTCTKAAFNSQ